MRITNLLSALSLSLGAVTGIAGEPTLPNPAIEVGVPNEISCKSTDGKLEAYVFLGSNQPLKLIVTTVDDQGAKWPRDMAGLFETDTVLGTLISGYEPLLADATQYFTLVVPGVLVELGTEKEVSFETQLVESWSGGLWFGNTRPAGTSVTNQYTSMACKARFVYLL
jgi:hypothetical protein